MSLVRVTETPESGQCTVKDNGGREYKRVFRVEFDSYADTGEEAVLSIPIERFAPYVAPNGLYFDRMALAEQAEAQREQEDAFSFIVIVNYSTKLWEEVIKALQSGGSGTTGHPPGSPHGNSTDPSSPENPLNRPWKVSHSSSTLRRRMERDRSTGGADGKGKPIANSAGDPIYVEEDMPIRVITITRNVPLPSVADQINWENLFGTVNKDYFLGRAPTTVKCHRIDGTTEYENNYSYFAQTLEFHVRRDDFGDGTSPWLLRLLDNGTHEIDEDGFRVPIVDKKTLVPVTENVPLDGTGFQLSVADIQAGNFHYLTFTQFPEKDFSVLGLG